MEFEPPIKERSNKELLEIIENKDAWEPKAFKQAEAELLERGISLSTQNNRRRSKKKFQSRVSKMKAASRYSTLEMVLLVLIGLPIGLLFSNLDLFWPGAGFKTKNRQGWLAFFLSIAIWASILYLIVILF
ncbi:MAG: hypothetical protein AAGD88_17370 [Bacteroidota bacterium]